MFKPLYTTLLALAAAGCGTPPGEPARPPAERQAAPAPAPAPVAVEAVALVQAYSDNAIAADRQFKDKLLEVTGTVQHLGREGTRNVLQLHGPQGARLLVVVCRGLGDDALAPLRVGATVTVRGTCRGEYGTYVQLHDCRIVK